MTGRERLIKTLKGEKVDRAPIWLGDTFCQDENLNPFIDEWMGKDSRLKAFKEFYYANCEIAKKIWAPGSNRNLSTPAANIHKIDERIFGDSKEIRYLINTPKGDLTFTDKIDRNVSTVWRVEYPVKAPEDIEKLLSIDYKIGPLDYSAFHKMDQALGDSGIVIPMIDTPAITICSLMPFEEYLLYTATDFSMIKELTEIAYGRVMLIL
jgi:hypothetical protein